MTDTDRWALDGDNRASFVVIPEERFYPEYRIKVDKSVAHRGQRAVFLVVNNGNSAQAAVHLSADDAESMATVLLYLADQWRKENPNGATR